MCRKNCLGEKSWRGGSRRFAGQPRRLSLRELGLADFFGPGFQVLLYLRHELVGYGAVDQAMVVA